jgi:hypothetical protein
MRELCRPNQKPHYTSRHAFFCCHPLYCLNDEAVKDHCLGAAGSGALEEAHKNAMNPLDPQCLAAGMGSDDAQSVCNAALDLDGTPCVWCDVAGDYGLCLSSNAADVAGQYLTRSNNKNVIETKAMSNLAISPFDPKCLIAQSQIDCDSTEDASGTQCVWCDVAGVFGLCLSSAMAHGRIRHAVPAVQPEGTRNAQDFQFR